MITFSQMLKDGGDDFSKLVTIDLTYSSPDTSSDFFVVSKSSTASITASADNAELISIASPEDMRVLSTAEIYPGYFRRNSITFAVSDITKLTAATAAILYDVQQAVSSYRLPYNPSTGFTAVYTSANQPYYGV